MASFFRLGSYRLSCLAWLVVVSTGFADFGQTDKNALYHINNMMIQIEQLLNDATSGTYPPEFYVRDDYTHRRLEDILTILESYTSHDYTSILDSIDSTLSDTGDTVTDIKDTLEDIYDSFGGITNSINKWGLSVSNAIANISVAGIGVVNTNLPFALAQTYLDSDYALDNLNDVFYYLYGYYPDDTLLSRITDLYLFFGGTSSFSQDVFSRLALLDALADITSYIDPTYDAYSALSILMNTVGSSLIPPLGEAYYYEYGTRPLLEFFTQATNDYVLANSAAITVDDNGGASFSQRFVSSVGSLASSFAPSVNTNIATVATNDIVNIEDDGYASKYEEIIEYDPSENGTDDILTYVNDVSIIEDFTSALSDSGEVSFSFDLPALGSTQNIVVQVDDVTSYTGAFFEVMFGFLKFVAFSVMAYKCWEIVVDVHFQKLR